MTKTVSPQPEIKGWCPGALRPMMSGDGLVVRVRPRGGRLTQEQAHGIADLSLRFGNGLIDLSARANVQLRGVTPDSHSPLIDGLRALGLIDASTEAEARRNVVVTPFWLPHDGTAGIVTSLTDALAAATAPQTPGKFGYAVDCGAAPVLRDTSADIRIERDEQGGLIVCADGAPYGAPVTADTAAETALALARWFLSSGGAPNGRGRMAAHLARGGRLPDAFTRAKAQVNSIPAPAPGLLPQGMLVGFEFGQMQAKTLSVLAESGPLRITPWRMILIEDVVAVPGVSDLITRADDPRRRMVACTGAPGCPQALAPTRSLARQLAPLIPPGRSLHISGCAKGCAHPGPAPFTLVGRPGGLFDLIRGGTAADPPLRTGLAPADVTPDLFAD